MKINAKKSFGLTYYEFEEPIHDTEELEKILFDFFCNNPVGCEFAVVMRANYEHDKNTEWWVKKPSIETCDICLSDYKLWWNNDWDEGQTIIDIYGFFCIGQLDDYFVEVD